MDYGSDLDCWDDVTAFYAELDGEDPRLVAQSIYRRLITPHGWLLDDPDYGFDVRTLLHKGLTPAQLGSVESRIRTEIMKDDRVESVKVAVTRRASVDGVDYGISVAFELANEPFSMTLKVSSAEVVMEEMRAG